MRLQYPDTVRIVRVPCTGRVGVRDILEALIDGADGVFVAGCMEGDCHYIRGNLRARQRVEYVKILLEEINLESGRVEMFNLSAGQGPRFAEIVREMTERIQARGPGTAPAAAGEPAPDQAEV